MFDCIIVGGGAAGLFAAITLKGQARHRSILLLEKTNVLLAKVRVSGGGRCNVTHHLFEPRELVKRYPRGERELIGAFHRFQPRDTIRWFERRGVHLHTEADGRMFPTTNSSETIAQALMGEADRLALPIRNQAHIETIKREGSWFTLHLRGGEVIETKKLLLATGSSRDGHAWARALGHTIESPVPSLFTFNCPSSPLQGLSGVSVERVQVSLNGSSLVQEGPLLITHFGFSGPAILRLSAFGARWMAERNYRCELLIRWVPDLHEAEIVQQLQSCKEGTPQKLLATSNPFGLPASLWRTLVPDCRWQDLSGKQLRQLAQRLLRDPYQVEGKTTHKEEFVTCGGVRLDEVQFKTMESRVCPGLYFAGEILDIDGITGGFNFQSAWTTGYLAAHGVIDALSMDRMTPP